MRFVFRRIHSFYIQYKWDVCCKNTSSKMFIIVIPKERWRGRPNNPYFGMPPTIPYNLWRVQIKIYTFIVGVIPEGLTGPWKPMAPLFIPEDHCPRSGPWSARTGLWSTHPFILLVGQRQRSYKTCFSFSTHGSSIMTCIVQYIIYRIELKEGSISGGLVSTHGSMNLWLNLKCSNMNLG